MRKIFKVTAAIIEKDGRILIEQRNSRYHLTGKWEFPGGKIEPDETPEECLARELKEEFAIEVSVGDFLGSNIQHYDHISIELMAYRTFWDGKRINSNGHKNYKWVSIDELSQYDFAPADKTVVDRLRRGEIKF
jgi:8-oxo-dGTP diphosphatase